MITASELLWIAGFLEGEGSFTLDRVYPTVSARQVQRWPLERIQKSLGGDIYLRKPGKEGWSPCSTWRVTGRRAAGTMMTLYSQMSPRRKEQIKKVLDSWRLVRPSIKHITCRYGHPIVQEWDGGRYCRTCRLEWRRKNNKSKKQWPQFDRPVGTDGRARCIEDGCDERPGYGPWKLYCMGHKPV